MNTDELGTVKPFQEEPDSEDDAASADNEASVSKSDAKEDPAEETKQEAAPSLTMINTSGPAAAPAENPDQTGAAKEEGESYEQEALNYLSLALQIIGDFCSENTSMTGDVDERNKLTAFLKIDTLLARVSLFNNAPDYKSALEDLAHVEELCVAFPDKNESTLTSAIFQMGRAEMELKEFDKAQACFTRTQELLRLQLITMTMTATTNGQASDGTTAATPAEQPLSEMVKPSIFDTEEMKRTKGIMIEV